MGVGLFDLALTFTPETHDLPKLDYPLEPNVREGRLLADAPWVRSLGRLEMSVTTESWKFPAPPAECVAPPRISRPSRSRQAGETARAGAAGQR